MADCICSLFIVPTGGICRGMEVLEANRGAGRADAMILNLVCEVPDTGRGIPEGRP